MTILVTGYKSKKALKEAVGKRLIYRETSMHGEEYRANGKFAVAHRPSLGHFREGREFFAEVTMIDGVIGKVE